MSQGCCVQIHHLFHIFFECSNAFPKTDSDKVYEEVKLLLVLNYLALFKEADNQLLPIDNFF